MRQRFQQLIRAGLPARLIGGENQVNFVRFKRGGVITLDAIERPEKLEAYQGDSITELTVEEACQFAFFSDLIDAAQGFVRSAAGVPATIFCTANPGGPGHTQVKSRYVDAGPAGTPIRDPDTGVYRVFIPSRRPGRILYPLV